MKIRFNNQKEVSEFTTFANQNDFGSVVKSKKIVELENYDPFTNVSVKTKEIEIELKSDLPAHVYFELGAAHQRIAK